MGKTFTYTYNQLFLSIKYFPNNCNVQYNMAYENKHERKNNIIEN